jgi:hypothetical protein
MLPTSDSYNFQSVQVEILIREAFERLGITGELVSALQLQSAVRSINLILLEWMGKTTNLWTLRNDFIPLFSGQGQYILPQRLLDIVQVNLRSSTRQLSPLNIGIAQSNTLATYDGAGGGNAANVYNADITTGCTQNAINGNISYDFGISNPGPNQVINTATITFIGIQSNVTRDYDLAIEQCQSGDDPADEGSWIPLLDIAEFSYPAGVTQWFDIIAPVEARAYRIREIGGNILDIRQIFNNNNVFDFNISNVSRYEYNTYPNKNLQSRPSIYYLDRLLKPTLYIWPTPAPQYNCLSYSYKQMMDDVDSLTDTVQIPAKMYPALIWGLTYQLALKFSPQLAEMAEAKYERAFDIATKEDTEDTIISIRGS